MKNNLLFLLFFVFIFNAAKAQNLLVNGDFEGTNNVGYNVNGIGYTQIFSPFSGVTASGNFAVFTNPKIVNDLSFLVGGDHPTGAAAGIGSGTGNMMIIDGNSVGGNQRFWRAGSSGTGVNNLLAGAQYEFSYWIKTISNNGNLPFIDLQITNSSNLSLASGTKLAPTPDLGWREVKYQFTASNSTIYIELWNTTTEFTGNDFAVDDFALRLLPTATISGDITTCINNPTPTQVTFTGANGAPPYTFTYNINGGSNLIVTTNAANSFVNVPVTTSAASTLNYNLVSVSSGNSPVLSQNQSGTAIIIVNPLQQATISGNTATCLNGTSPNITFTGFYGVAPYTFTYNINGGTSQSIVTTSGNTVTLPVPTDVAGTFVYNLLDVSSSVEVDCQQTQLQRGRATVAVVPSLTATISSNITKCPGQTVTFNLAGTPFTTINILSSGGLSYSVELDIDGNALFTTPVLNSTTSYSITSITTPYCNNNSPMAANAVATIDPAGCFNTPSSASSSVHIEGPVKICNSDITGSSPQPFSLEAKYVVQQATTSYVVNSIPYQPAFNFASPNTIPISTVNPDDFWSGASATLPYTIPFNFTFYNSAYNKLSVGSNGVLSFNLTYQSSGAICPYVFPNNIPDANAPIKNAIFGVYQDIIFSPLPGPNSSINYYVLSTGENAAPNRVFVMNTNEVYLYSDSSGTGSGLQSYQVILYETTNIIDVIVKRRKNTTGWQNSFGIIGLINANGTQAIAAPGRNRNNSWQTLTGESWRFLPNGSIQSVLEWYKNDETTPFAVNVNPITGIIPVAGDYYRAEVTYIGADGLPLKIKDTYAINDVADPPVVTLAPESVNICSGSGFSFKINQNNYMLNGATPANFEFHYFKSEQDAIDLFDEILNIDTYQPLSNIFPQTLYVSVTDFSTGCSNIKSFTIGASAPPSGTFEYAEDGDEFGFCRSRTPNNTLSTTELTPLTAGGKYSILPNNGIVIDENTGVINLTDAIPGDYIITYKILATESCPEFTTTAPVKIILCTDLAPITTVCGGSAFTLQTSDSGSNVTYTWSDNTPIVIGTTTLPTLTLPNAPTADGVYAFSVVASYGTINSVSSSENLTVNAVAQAVITTLTPGVCTGGTGTITINGTENAIFYYKVDNGTPIQGTILAGGTTITVNPIVPFSTYQLVSVERNLIPNCPQIFTDNAPGTFVKITPGAPDASIDVVNPNPNPVCQNNSTTVTISGNAGSTVQYSVNGTGNFTAIIDATTGVVDITTANLTSNTTYELISITTAGTNSCTKTFAAGAAKVTVTISPLPTVSEFSTTTAFVCTNTKGKLTFTGTLNSTIVYSDGNTNYNVAIDGTGTNTIDTPNNLTANTTFSLVSITDALACSTTTFTLPNVLIQISAGPTITSQPQATTVCEGPADAILTVEAVGAGLTYQWNDGTSNVGIDSNTLNIPAILANNGKSYTCTITDSCGVAVTSPTSAQPQAIVTVTAKPFNLQDPQGTPPSTPASICVGTTIDLTASASGSGIAYKWFRDTTDLSISNPTALTNHLVINNVQTIDSGNYSYVASNCASTKSADYTITVNPLPTISSFTTSTAFICTNTKGKLTFTGTPNTTIVYSDGSLPNYTVVLNASGTTTPLEIDTPDNLTADTTFSLVSITNNDPTLACSNTNFTLPNVLIQISAGPTITTQPQATTVCEGAADAILTVAALGAGLTYQWNDGTNNVGTNSNTLSVPAILANNGTQYTCRITDACGVFVDSAPAATVNVTAKPVFTQQPQGTSPICAGEEINLNVTTTGVGVTYKWFRGTTDLSTVNLTALTGNLVITNAQTTDSGDYTCVATTCSSVTSLIKTVTVNPLPVVNSFSATNASICTGTKGTLEFTATPNSTIVYSDGLNNFNVSTLTGTVSVSTVNNLTTSTTFTLVSITNNLTSCVTNNLSNLQVTININALPTVSDPTPIATLICSGDPATTLSVVATGSGLIYLWKKDNSIVANSNSSFISVPSVAANTGNYTCTVTDICGQSVTSIKASLTINDAPIVTQNPIGSTICSGTTINLSIVTTGTGLTYQWKRNAVDLPTTNATAVTSNLVIVNAQTTDSGDYTCEAKSGTCSVLSAIAAMTVNQAPQITTQPVSNAYCTGDNITLSVVVSISTVTYQWQFNGTNLLGETNFELKLINVTTANSGDYVCLIDNLPCKQIKSNKAVILVKAPPFATIQTQIPNTTVCAGTDSNLIFNGTPNAEVTYTINGGANQILSLSPSGTSTIITTGILETTTVYQLISVSTNDYSPVCTTALTEAVTINVVAIPEPTLAADGFICIDENNVTLRKFRMETGFPASQYDFQWYEDNVALAAPDGTNDFYDADKKATYKVEITDRATGCKRSAMTKISTSLQPKTVTATVLSGYFDDNATIEITADPINGDYEYQLDYGPFQDSNIFTNVQSGDHNVYARDKQECNTTPAFWIKIVKYPKFFTPNGDGINDYWNISNLFVQSNAKIYIFDRFGKFMKQISTTGQGWDGNFNASPAPADDYWFVIKYEEQQINKEFKAHFTLKR